MTRKPWRHIRSVSIFVLWAAILVTAVPAFSQVDTGTVLGTIKDQSGAVVPGAKVTLTNEGTGLALTTTTTNDGSYIFTPIRIGTYSVEVEMSGFSKAIQSHVTVNVQQQVVVDLTLVPGALTQVVEVTGAPPQLQTQNASVGMVASTREILDLPLNGRNYTFLAQLSAGVTSINPSRNMDLTGSFVANGLTTVHNNYILDGIDNNNDTVDFLNGASYVNLPPPDAIQEFKLQTGNFSAEFGRAGGAVLNATIKSGTNKIHGSAWEFLRNDKLDSAYFFQNAAGVQKSTLRQNQFGASVGGPIVIPHVYDGRNKTFFFGDYEGTRIRQTSFHNPTVPTGAERASGYTNFQDLLTLVTGTRQDALGRTFPATTIFDPATTRQVAAGQVDPETGLTATANGYVRDPFYTGASLTGVTDFTSAAQMAYLNQLPQGRLDSNAIKLLNLYPDANLQGTFYNDYAANFSQPDDNNHFDVRVDHNFSDRDQMFGRASYSKRHANIPGDFTGLGTNPPFGGGDFNDMSLNLAFSETHSFTPTMINEARFGFSRLRTTSQPPYANTPGVPEQFGIPGVPQGNQNGGLPTISISGLTGLGAGAFASPNGRISNTTQFTENLTKIYGSHTFKGGFEYQSVRFPWIDPAWSRGEFDFGGYTGIPGVGGPTTGMADLLLTPIASTVPGGVDNVGGPNGVFASNISNIDDIRHYYGTYFQDDWKVTPKLTVNLGLRWEFFGQIREKYGAQANFVPGTPGGNAAYLINRKTTPLSPSFTSLLAQDGIKLVYSTEAGLTNTPLTNFAPRVGLAYSPTPKLVMRAAYGIFYGGFENVGGAPDPGYNYPFAVNLSAFRNNDVSPIVYSDGQHATLERGLLSIVPTSDSPSFSASGLGLVGYQQPWKTAYTQEWNFTLEYQFTPNQTVSLGYVGNSTRHMLSGDKRNVPNVLLPPNTPVKDYIPFPDFQQNSDYVAPNADAWYNGLQFSYTRRMSQGLTVLADYTYAHCMTTDKNILGSFGDGFFYRASTIPGFGIKKDYHFCGSDVPQIFHASGIYQLPFGKGKHFGGNVSGPVNHVIGGWNTQWILTLQNGFPFNIGCAITTNALPSGNNCVAFLVPGQALYTQLGPHGINQFMNPAAFANPPVATTVGQTDFAPLGGRPFQIHGPSFNNFDFSLFKDFRTSETTHLEFRSEFFNFLNHPNFGNSFKSSNYTDLQNFGVINGTRGIPREIQLALKFYW
ncbi:MAG: carboxypeptidase regulatory-like domain-containing protein [Acidobacteriia bacterium]|nr:carboxypeptidase regulatory-like domain-containing protein [Terriglobia bacterium]